MVNMGACDAGDAGSPDASDEESFMQGMIRTHLTNILRPISEHVHELRAQVQQLGEQITVLDTRIDDSTALQVGASQDVLTVKCGISETNAKVEKLSSEIQVMHREKTRMEAEHRVTKANITKLFNSMHKTDAASTTVNQRLEYLDKDVHGLRIRLTETCREFSSQSEVLKELRSMFEDLNARNMDWSKELSDLGRLSSQMRRDVDNFVHSYEDSENGGRHQILALKESIRVIEKRFAETNKDHSIEERVLKALEGRIQKIESCLGGHRNPDGGIGKIDKIESSLKATNASLKEHLERVHKLEEEMRNVGGKLTMEHEVVWNELKDMGERLTANRNLIESVDARIEESQQRDEDRISRTEEQMERLVVSQGKLEQSSDAFVQDLYSVQRWQSDVVTKLELQHHELTGLREDHKTHGKDLETAKNNLMQMREDLLAANARTSKVYNRADSVRRSITGMSKGFEDTFRNLSQEEGSLFGSPGWGRRGSTGGTGLPTLQATPRNIAG
eukprot:TRINITY_DN45725_c0_g1_i1.p1 TRINITY_DN45725_c0_g1~~TRINITY_DN45725_c0_g1_i1.p1  ORF type:complete len:547 (+),score=117.78 TRINITY_DN45725_c0_g1_i1:130-1641(+)